MKETSDISGYCTITYKLKVYTKYENFMKLTKELYNQAILEYYNLLLENQEFLNLSNQYCLRELEKLTILSRDGKKPKNYLELDLPTYFRRSAINKAIGSVRSYVSLLKKYEDTGENIPSKAKSFNNSPVFYKGMYRNLTSNSIELKLWNGTKWSWYLLKLNGRNFENAIEILSPTLVINSKRIMLHIPIKQQVEDVRPVKMRMQDENLKVCGISFSNYDNFAICTILNRNCDYEKSLFIKGGNDYKARTSKILSKIKKDRQVNKIITPKDHKTYWEKLEKIDDYTAHKVSKQIIDFCLQNEVKVIAITKIENDVAGFQRKVGKYSPIYLRRKIVNNLEYKSFKNGLLITTVRQNYTSSRCYKCRSKIKRKESEFICENGHQGNYYFNSSVNIGMMCLKKFGLSRNPS